ncbi:hypothetical protein C0J50_10718 [Silurus asotus]|uniref:Uncharacterized protein n=1 Tax=Silurus asotus TaxID=30991 RepID=A0AAD5AG34_SILAS|nr:hypothetical protein C0J50_10718 [Silurus asotus]
MGENPEEYALWRPWMEERIAKLEESATSLKDTDKSCHQLNILLNEPGAQEFDPQISFFILDYNGFYLTYRNCRFVISINSISRSFVLSTIQDLLSARLPNLTDSLTVLNFTYEKLSETSYVVTFTLNINNISIPENPDLRNNTYNTVQSIVNNAVSEHDNDHTNAVTNVQ